MTGRSSGADKAVITVLGASGFIGSAVTAALASWPVRLRAVARGPSPVPRDGWADVDMRTADLTDAAQLRAAVAGSDAVLHLVLPSPVWQGGDTAASERVNVRLMHDLVECLRADQDGAGPPVVVFAGSVSQVGPPPWLPINGSEPDYPESVFDRQKHTAERILMKATVEGVVRGISLRLPMVYGNGPATGRNDRGVLATVARRALAGEPVAVWNDGAMERDLLHVEDTAAAFVAALDNADALVGRHWVIGTGRGERLYDVFAAIAEIVSVHIGYEPVPIMSVRPPEQALRTDLSSIVVDSSAFGSITGWRSRVPLVAGLERMVTNLIREGPVAPATREDQERSDFF
jgi:nucleoside-diphosphate-sugar epimerase